jgi:hypothetical protein
MLDSGTIGKPIGLSCGLCQWVPSHVYGLPQSEQHNVYPMPRVEELLGKAKFTTTLDLGKGYYEVPVASEN